MDTLHKLQEERMEEKKITLHHNHIKRWFDKRSVGKANFDVSELVFKWEKSHEDKGKHTNFESLWISPYIVHEKLGPHMYHLQSLEQRIGNIPVNDQDL